MGCSPSRKEVNISCCRPMFFSSLSTMARDFGADPTHPNIGRQRQHQEEGFRLISAALNIDERESSLSSKLPAIRLYEEGIQELEKGVALFIPVNPNDASLVRAHKLKEKMRENIRTAEERANYLRTSLHLDTLSSRAAAVSDRAAYRPVAAVRPAALTVPPAVQNARSAKRSPTAGTPPSSRLPRNNRAAELRIKSAGPPASGTAASRKVSDVKELKGDSRLKALCSTIRGVDPKLVEMILAEVVPQEATGVRFEDVAGQDKAKAALHEMVVLPALRPELFTGLRSPARGLLLFGPPGNGKTLMARALATEAKCNLVNISSSSLTSKWVGEGEKLVRALFSVARALQPSIIFIDEIDALLSERRSGEHEALRRIKTEFLLQFEGMMTGKEEKVVVVAATNRPQELDDAALRRFTKRVYVQMPDPSTRAAILRGLLAKHGSPLSTKDIERVVRLTEGYTCSDVTNLAKDAAMAPIREIPTAELAKIKPEDVRSLSIKDFEKSCERVRRSLSLECLQAFEKWNQAFGDIS